MAAVRQDFASLDFANSDVVCLSVCVLQAQHVFSPVMQGSARMMAPPTHGQPSLVSSSTTQYPEQTHTMYGTSADNSQLACHCTFFDQILGYLYFALGPSFLGINVVFS